MNFYLILSKIIYIKTIARILLPCPLTSVQVDETCDLIYIGSKNGKIYTINISTYSASKFPNVQIINHPSNSTTTTKRKEEEEAISTLPQGHEYEITSLKLLKNNILISGDKNGFIRIWDINELCTIRVFQAWNDDGYRISNIMDMSLCNNNHSCNNNNIIAPPPPLQKYANDNGNETLLLLPKSNKRKSIVMDEEYKMNLLKQCKEFYSSSSSSNENKEKDEEIIKLKKELNEAKLTIKRWENVNTKLMTKLNKEEKNKK